MDIFILPIYIPGTLTGNHIVTFELPFDAQLIHVSAVASNASNGLITIGNSDDDDIYLDDSDLGDSADPAEYGRTDFINDQYPHIANGTIIKVTIDYDGASGTAAQNVFVVLTFSVG